MTCVTHGADGEITSNWIPKFNPHTFFSSIARDADKRSGVWLQESEANTKGTNKARWMNDFVKM